MQATSNRSPGFWLLRKRLEDSGSIWHQLGPHLLWTALPRPRAHLSVDLPRFCQHLRGPGRPQVTFRRRVSVTGVRSGAQRALGGSSWPPGLIGLRFLPLPEAGTPPVAPGSSESPNSAGRVTPLLPGGPAPGGKGTQGPPCRGAGGGARSCLPLPVAPPCWPPRELQALPV